MNNKTHPTMRRIGLAVLASIAVSSSVSAAPLEEIIVTAQKRTESLQDVSISITTLDGGKIEEAGINSFNDLSAYVPNLMVSENAVTTSIIMRGIGPGASQSFEQSVGLYVDGIHLAKGRQFRTGLFDLERVEVLRGPQGILFGKNTLAGAVNVTSATAQVGEELSGKISLSMESNDGHTVEGNLSGSLTDNLAVRVAYKDREAGGYLQNSITGVDGPTADESLWRIGLTWQPTDNLSVKLKHSEGDFTREGGSATLRLIDPTPNLAGSARLTYGANALFFPQVGENVANGVVDLARDGVVPGGLALAQSLGRDLDRTTEKTEGTFTENKDTSLNIEYEFNNGYTLTSVTGLTEYEFEDGIDVDFAPIRFGGRADISEYDQTSQEFRIASEAATVLRTI